MMGGSYITINGDRYFVEFYTFYIFKNFRVAL